MYFRLSKRIFQTLNPTIYCYVDDHLWVSLFPQFCQVGNFSIHVALRNLKLPGEHFLTMRIVLILIFTSIAFTFFLNQLTVQGNTMFNLGLPIHLRFKNQEDSLPNEKSIHMDLLAGLLSKLHIWGESTNKSKK